MERESITSMLARIVGIPGDLDGGKEACDAVTNGFIDMKWCLEAALMAQGKAREES